MAGWKLEKHQPEPWKVDGWHVLSATGFPLARAVLTIDARRIVAAINDTRGIPTAALEAGFIRDLLGLKIWPRAVWQSTTRLQGINAADVFLHEPLDPAEAFPFDRRVEQRRRGDRRRR